MSNKPSARMRSEGYDYVYVCVCLSVSLSVCQQVARERYRRLQNYASLKIIRRETTAFERYAFKTSEKANMHNRTGDLIRSLW